MKRLIVFLLLFTSAALAINAPLKERKFPRGCKPTSAVKIAAAAKYEIKQAAPAEFAIVPKQLSMWGNDQYRDCVSAEEAYAKACNVPEIMIDDAIVIAWARKHGYLNGADLGEVMDSMLTDGFVVGQQRYNDGGKRLVDYTDEAVLQSAISQGPVKIAIDADALPSGAGNAQGWFALGDGQQYRNTDHCTGLSGYGSVEFLYGKMGLPVPSGIPAGTKGYLHFTWSTIGFVTHKWILSTCVEAWVRNPTTVGIPPLPGPVPPDPIPPTPVPPTGVTITLSGDLKAGTYQIGGPAITLDPKMTLEDLIKLIQKSKPAPPPMPPPVPKKPIRKCPDDLDAI